MFCKQHSAKIIKKLHGNKLKVTDARLILLDIFEHANKPLSVKDISIEFGKMRVDKVTLYRIIKILKNLGLIKQIQLKDRRIYYEINSNQHHHHLVCDQCGTISDIKRCEIIKYDCDYLKTTGFARIFDHSLEFFGICNKCFNK